MERLIKILFSNLEIDGKMFVFKEKGRRDIALNGLSSKVAGIHELVLAAVSLKTH